MKHWESLSGKDREVFDTILERGLLTGNLDVEPGNPEAAFVAARLVVLMADAVASSEETRDFLKDEARKAIEASKNLPLPEDDKGYGSGLVAVAGVLPGGGGAGGANLDSVAAIARSLQRDGLSGLKRIRRIFQAAQVFDSVMRSRLDAVRGHTPDGPTIGQDLAEAVDDELVSLGIPGLRTETLSRVGEALTVTAKRDAKYPRVLFLLDTSGSMSQLPRLPTLQGMLWSIAKDRHAKGTVVTFGDKAGGPFALNPRTRNKVLSLAARGGTELGPGISRAHEAPGKYEVILVLTDGVLHDPRSLRMLPELARKKGRGRRAKTVALHVGNRFAHGESFDEAFCVRDLLGQGSEVFAKALIR